jgi:uncharacterized membrane protein YfcA
VLVSAIGCVRFYRLGLLIWRSAYLFAALGLPFSLLGGALHLPPSAYQPVVGALLLVAGAQMVRSALATKSLDRAVHDTPPFLGSPLVGGLIGLLSGVTSEALSRAACAVTRVGDHAADGRYIRRVQPD